MTHVDSATEPLPAQKEPVAPAEGYTAVVMILRSRSEPVNGLSIMTRRPLLLSKSLPSPSPRVEVELDSARNLA